MIRNPFPETSGFANVAACRCYAEEDFGDSADQSILTHLSRVLRWALHCSARGEDEARAYAPVVVMASSKLPVDTLQRALRTIPEDDPLDAQSLGRLFAQATCDPDVISRGTSRVLSALPLTAAPFFVLGLLEGAERRVAALEAFVSSDTLGALDEQQCTDHALGLAAFTLSALLVELTESAADLLVMFESESLSAAIVQRLQTTHGLELRRIFTVLSYSGGPQFREPLTQLYDEAPDEESRLRLLLAILASKWGTSEEGQPHVV